MKKFFAYLLLFSFLIVSLSACAHKDDPPASSSSSNYRADIMLRADAGNGEVTLDWQMDPYASTYNIYVGTSSSSLTKITTLPASLLSAPYTVTSLADGTPLANGTTYYFSVSGVNSYNVESKLAIPITATPLASPPPAAPENVRANAGNAQITITWDTVAGATSYNLYYQKFDNNLYSLVKIINGVTSPYSGPYSSDLPIINKTDANPQLTYFFFVSAVNDMGTTDTGDDLESSASFVVYATPSDPPPPAAPVLETPVLVGTNVTLNWNVVPTATYYIVYVGTAKGVTKATGAPSTVTVPPTPTTTFPTGTYYFVVTAVNDMGTTDTGDDLESTESNEIKVTVP